MTFIVCLFLFSFVYFSLNAWRNCTNEQVLLISEGVIYFLSLQTSNFLFKCKQQSIPLLLIIYLSLFSFGVRDSAMASITERAQRMEKDLRETNAKHDRAAAELQVRRENLRTSSLASTCVVVAHVRSAIRVRGHTTRVREEHREERVS